MVGRWSGHVASEVRVRIEVKSLPIRVDHLWVDRRIETDDEVPTFVGATDIVDVIGFASPTLINMLNRPERLRDSLDQIGEAVGRPVSAGDDVHLIRPRQFETAGGFANPGFRSNLDAHLRAARWARENDLPRVLVVEDDLAFSPDWFRHGPRLLAALTERDWHIASLGYLDAWGEAPGPEALGVETPGVEGLGVEQHSTGSDEPAAEAGWVRFSGQVNGAHAYLLNHCVYDRWIGHLETVADGTPGDDRQGPMPSDGAINTFPWVHPEVIRLVAVPNLVGTRPTRSDITPSNIDRLPIVGSLAEHVRTWRRRRHGSKVANYK